MPLTVVYSPDHVRHVPDGEIWVGVRIAGTELPSRGEAIHAAVTAAGYDVVGPHPIDDDDLLSVHDSALVGFLQNAYADWQTSDYPRDPGQDRVVPYAFPHPHRYRYGHAGAIAFAHPDPHPYLYPCAYPHSHLYTATSA